MSPKKSIFLTHPYLTYQKLNFNINIPKLLNNTDIKNFRLNRLKDLNILNIPYATLGFALNSKFALTIY